MSDLFRGMPDVVQDLKELAQDVGLVSQDVELLEQEYDTHTIQDASTTQKGHVQLSNATDSDSETTASTPKAVKTVNDKLTTHLDEYATTSSLTYYVNSNGNDANDGLTSNTALRTIQSAINKLPQIINHYCLINVEQGTYNEDLRIEGLIGTSYLDINGFSKSAEIKSVTLTQNSCYISLVGLRIREGITSSRNSQIKFFESDSTGDSMHGVSSYADNVFIIENVEISNKSNESIAASAIRGFDGTKIVTKNVGGTNNFHGLRAFGGSEIVKSNVTLISTIAETIADGGLIR